ncbi:unnamed protein product [Blepharisma stoltei]|uniref:Arylesterase n=1 Tax=Blepharisma stoltei TaxID=1481888 RepID=A0AAU9JDX0_9CILI|nr:unnamed protein product [Blepharisma stoltei]
MPKLVLLSLIMLCFSWIIYVICNMMDLFILPSYQNYEECEVIQTNGSLEDITFYGNIAIGGEDDRVPLFTESFAASKRKEGRLLAIDIGSKSTYEIPIHNFPKEIGFHPHGLFLFKNETLYILNHAFNRGGERVEVIKLQENEGKIEATYLRSIVFDDEFIAQFNDLAVIDEDEFYITQSIPYNESPEGLDLSGWHQAKMFLTMQFTKSCNLYYCKNVNGKADCKSQDKSNLYNGINILGSTLYVTESVLKQIITYNITEDRSLKFIESFNVLFHPDNIEVSDEPNILYVAGFSKISELADFMEKLKTVKYPELSSGVYKLNHTIGDVSKKNMIMQKKMPISVAAAKNNTFIIGSFTHDMVMICPIKQS